MSRSERGGYDGRAEGDRRGRAEEGRRGRAEEGRRGRAEGDRRGRAVRRKRIVLLLLSALAASLLGLGIWMIFGWRETETAVRFVYTTEEETDGAAGAGGAAPVEAETAGADGLEPAGKASGDSVEKRAGAAPASGDEEGPAGAEEGGPLVLLFSGDVYFSDYVLNAYDAAGGIEGVLDEGIRREIAGADIFMVNQEFPFTDRGTAAKDKQFTFRLPPERVKILKEMGADIVTLANNHILDFGPEGITDSLAALDGAGILHVGAGEDLEQASRLEVIERKGHRIGFLGTSRVYMSASWAAGVSHPGVFSTYDPAAALEAVRRAKEQCDYLVVYVHWGVERETEPRDYQRDMGRRYLDAGADLVVGSHPHVLQEIEERDGKYIAYSLGNFVFGSSIPDTELLKVVLEDGRAEASVIPCRSSGGYTRRK